GGEYAAAAHDHHGTGVRRFLQARDQRLAELNRHRVGLAVGHAQDRYTILLGEFDHVARCSRPSAAASEEGALITWEATAPASRWACSTAIVSTAIAIA